MNVLEKELEDIIFETPLEKLQERGLHLNIYGKYKIRQLDLGSYGRADIVYLALTKKIPHRYRELHINVVEVKKETINVDTFIQALRYIKGIQRFIYNQLDGLENLSISYEITLIGKDVDKKSDFIFLPDFVENVSIYTVKIDIEKGIRFKREVNYSQIEEEVAVISKEELADIFLS